MNRWFPQTSSGISSVSRSVFSCLLIAVLIAQVLFVVPVQRAKAGGIKPSDVSTSSPPEAFRIENKEVAEPEEDKVLTQDLNSPISTVNSPLFLPSADAAVPADKLQRFKGRLFLVTTYQV